MGIELMGFHYVYLIFILLILGVMIFKKDTTLICIVGIFVLGLMVTKSLSASVSGIFNSFIYAIKELLGTILIISIIVGMSNALTETGVSDAMIRPFTKLMKNKILAYWIVGILMMVISWFFWPSPAVALIGVVLLPAAIRAGLPALGVAVAMNLFGHGIALSSDFVIQGAPKLTADGAGISVGNVISASVPLVIIMGVVTTTSAFYFLMRDINKGNLKVEEKSYSFENSDAHAASTLTPKVKNIFAFTIPILFALDVVAMYIKNLRGGDATALVGGTAVFILIVLTILNEGENSLSKITSHLMEGLQFGFKVFSPVIPIAAFFYLGDSGITAVFGDVLPKTSNGIVNDLGIALANAVPINATLGATTLSIVGAITGLDGSGFSGISLVGSVAKLFGTAIGSGTATLTALGQIAAIWVGGGTLIPWAVIPVAAICDIDPFELVKRNLKPVIIGLVVTTIAAIFFV